MSRMTRPRPATRLLAPTLGLMVTAAAMASAGTRALASEAIGSAQREASMDQTRIQLKRRVSVGHATGVVRLGDVADISGPGTADLAELTVAAIAGVGEVPAATLTSIRQRIREAGINAATVTVRGPRACSIERLPEPSSIRPIASDRWACGTDSVLPAQVASNAGGWDIRSGGIGDANTSAAGSTGIGTSAMGRLALAPADPGDEATGSNGEVWAERRLRDWLAARSPLSGEAMSVDLDDRDREQLGRLPAGVSLEFIALAENRLGRVPVRVQAYRDRDLIQRLTVDAMVSRLASVLVADRDLRYDEPLTAADVKIEQRQLIADRDQPPLTSPQEAVGQALNRSLRRGDIVYADFVETPVLVERGQSVTVRAFVGNALITTQARAEEAGGLDETIRLRAANTRQTFAAVVSGPGEVRLEVH